MNATARMVGALLPRFWPARDAALAAAAEVDRRHGADAVGLVLRAWAAWRDGKALPRDRWVADLLLEVGDYLVGIA